jgi:hypothetical protein
MSRSHDSLGITAARFSRQSAAQSHPQTQSWMTGIWSFSYAESTDGINGRGLKAEKIA